MMSRTKHRDARARRRLRQLFAWIASLGLLGAAAQANAIVRLDRDVLEARVQALRAALHESADAPAAASAASSAPDPLMAQWNNWNNWTNWNNWKNWGNWLNK